MDELTLKRYCCRRMIMTHVDLIEKLLRYNPAERDAKKAALNSQSEEGQYAIRRYNGRQLDEEADGLGVDWRLNPNTADFGVGVFRATSNGACDTLLFVLGILSGAHQTPKVTLDHYWEKLSQGTGSLIMHVQRIQFGPVRSSCNAENGKSWRVYKARSGGAMLAQTCIKLRRVLRDSDKSSEYEQLPGPEKYESLESHMG
ncbi:hypothetical protein SS1G_05855 [Sclerotinia sclerotiorum 1980 UF-70]|uniref:DNA-directed RNA polymerases I, II, and III subunit RPABC5 n=1 Tax=Sclerotinia sclerotiorum (strain ATCC 18683 / 1980 / Ss-1) TaxID=665079 RepID=A7EKK8_SCLS1|nr:hypothetical protein SS1G_05855 [Sclerotinia sclerotiorum 1980 UF-70]EDO03374.1 hypothetical protein SS1G_05855 [Sclerotinia sclerotiorum 1980 UF-70]